MPSSADFKGQTPAWCPGCGNFSILRTFKEAMAELGLEPHQFLVVSGIGQAAKFPHYIKCNTFNGLHGRSLPVATGIRLANHSMRVFAIAGDGDCYGEGGNHLVHAMRRNIGVTLFVHNNQVYGLTKGQASPTTAEGTKTKNQPFGVFSEQLNPLALAVALDCGFVGRGFCGDMEHLKALMKEAANHPGFSIVDILQNCISFNKVNTLDWYRERVYRLGTEHDPSDRMQAFRLALEWGDRIPLGVIYRNSRPPYEGRIPILDNGPLVNRSLDASKIADTLKEFF